MLVTVVSVATRLIDTVGEAATGGEPGAVEVEGLVMGTEVEDLVGWKAEFCLPA